MSLEGKVHLYSRRRGSVLMEAVVCLPLLLLLVTGIWQFCRIWEARFFTWLAAYNAARTTLVYNNRDYAYLFSEEEPDSGGKNQKKWVFYETQGIAWLAAINTLAWISQTDADDDDEWYLFPCFGRVPYSTHIREQVRIVSEYSPDILLSKTNPFSAPDMRYSIETGGVVRVSVEYKLPLIFSIFDFTSMFPEANKKVQSNLVNFYSADGILKETNDPLSGFTNVETEDDEARKEKRLGKTFALRETVVLPKPWSTEWYPVVSPIERMYLLGADDDPMNALKGWWGEDIPPIPSFGSF